MKNWLSTLIFFTLTTTLFAQGPDADQFHKQMQEVLKAQREMMQNLLDDSASGDFEKRMEDIMKRFGGQDFPSGFDHLDEGPVVGEYDWVINDTHKILKIKVTQVKDHPLDIKIEKGMVRIKGDVESVEGKGQNQVKRKVSFERSFSLPDDVDQKNPQFENKEKEGELWIKFARVNPRPATKEAHRPPVQKSSTDGRLPVPPSDEAPRI